MKTYFKQITAGTFIALLLLAGIVSAHGTEIKASGHEIIETSLQLENWMTDEIIWNTNRAYTVDLALETETALEVESWMIRGDTWNFNNQFVTEAETELEIENWMTSENMWEVQETAIEEELTLENWMVDDEVWK